jgi:hypothetical protein
MLKTQAALLSIFTAPSESDISLSTPLVYSDRLRVRNPGDAKFALGPHIDGGSIERWEDTTYRQVYEKILAGKWEEFDAWEMGKFGLFGKMTQLIPIDKRADAVQDLYPGPGSVSTLIQYLPNSLSLLTLRKDRSIPLVARLDLPV